MMDNQNLKSQESTMDHGLSNPLLSSSSSRYEEIQMEKQNSYFNSDVVQNPLLSGEEDLMPPIEDQCCFEEQLDSRFPLNDSQSLNSQESITEYKDLPVKPFVPRGFPFHKDNNSHCKTLSIKNTERKKASKFVFYFFDAIAEGDIKRIRRCLVEIQKSGLNLSYYTLREWDTGKTCLMKALLMPNKNTPNIVNELLTFAEQTNDLKELINAELKHRVYEGQTALHISIERKQMDIVRLLVSKGANVNARACGLFFQLTKKRKDYFYFGEYPLSLAACLNQPDVIEFLLENEYNNCADITAQDYLGNTVLHALVAIADDSKENMYVIEMYDWILKKSEKQRIKALDGKREILEKICNNKGLTPLQLAAKSGKLQILTHILNRTETELDVRHLSRKFVNWTYGPVCCSLYDLSEIDSSEKNSVLEMVVYNTSCKNHYEMLTLEPLNDLLEVKWKKFAAVMFYINTIWYLFYITTFSLITSCQSQAIQTSEPDSKCKGPWILAGQIYTALVAIVMLMRCTEEIIHMCPIKFTSAMNDMIYILFFIQALLVLCTNIQYWTHKEEHISVTVAFAVCLGWFNVIYFCQGFKITGIYGVLLQQMIFRDILRFLIVYLIFLMGFGQDECTEDELCSPFAETSTAVLELFKLTMGLGDLSIHQQSRYPAVFLFLLVLYVILTTVLLMNMLIALMGETVNHISQDSEKIWKLQRAMTILDTEKVLPKSLVKWLLKERITSNTKVGVTPFGQDDRRTCLRVNEVHWEYWREKLRSINEDPGTIDNMEELSYSASQLNA
uniref:Transient receptor potential cation channel subfamily V member 3-like n=1 Tax=Geotrypetes seraphini TaxID=260995 RepID=A0A6P8P4Y8_GEOSA|nr:transient receptor potential cation channel subfamily V member 3-like [Geotrypetes seraphini]